LAISFCDKDERPYLRDIQKLINQKVPVISEHPFVDDTPHNQNDNRSRNSKKPYYKKKNSGAGSKNWRRKKNNSRKPNSRREH